MLGTSRDLVTWNRWLLRRETKREYKKVVLLCIFFSNIRVSPFFKGMLFLISKESFVGFLIPICTPKTRLQTQVTDQCTPSVNPLWCSGDVINFGLSNAAFAEIANNGPGCGVIATNYRRVGCEFEPPIHVRSKDGVKAFNFHTFPFSSHAYVKHFQLPELNFTTNKNKTHRWINLGTMWFSSLSQLLLHITLSLWTVHSLFACPFFPEVTVLKY